MNWYKKAQETLKRRIYVGSNAIEYICYDEPTKTLTVRFKRGQTYEYVNVPKKVFENLNIARSKGEYFNRAIKDKYDYSSD